MIQQLSNIKIENSFKEIESLSETILIVADNMTERICQLQETFNSIPNLILRQQIIDDFQDFTDNLTKTNSNLNKLVITAKQKNKFKAFQDKYYIYFEHQTINILKIIDINISKLEDCLALISTLELFEQAKTIDVQNYIDWFKNLSISLDFLLEVLEKDIFLERYKRFLEIIEVDIKAIVSMKNLRYLYTKFEEYRQEEFKKYLSSTISTGKAILYEIDKKLLKFKNLDEEYTLLQVKEGEESFNSLDEFFDYVDESYIESLK